MKRQSISISLQDIERLKQKINKELESINEALKYDKQKFNRMKKRIRIVFNIINYPTKSSGKSIYCSDTWQFEDLIPKKGQKK